MTRVSVGKVADLPQGKLVGAEIDGEKILVANVGGSFHAMRSTCNHAGGPLHEGKLEGKIDALTAQGRMQGLIMTCLPLFLLLILAKMEPEAMAPMFNTLAGWATLGVIGFMEVIGYFAIQKIVTIDV